MNAIHKATVTIEMVGFNPILTNEADLTNAVSDAIEGYRDASDDGANPLANISFNVDAHGEESV